MRKRLRLAKFDYASDNVYFITICTYKRRVVFTAEYRETAERELLALPARFPGLTIDTFNVRPDHLHAVVRLAKCADNLSAILQAYKSITANELRRNGLGGRVWQRGFYDRIVRSEDELTIVRSYVDFNDVVHASRRR